MAWKPGWQKLASFKTLPARRLAFVFRTTAGNTSGARDIAETKL
jgi:hypothetical protein